jgi:ring-1,2-phenylacetyl-CoA epoxidase subunit PaaE
MRKWNLLRISELVKLTKDSVKISFEIPEHLKESFQYKAGQHVTVRAFVNGEDIRRPYSICTTPDDLVFSIAIKQIPGGLFSSYANQTLKKGDLLSVMAPIGSFGVDLHPDNNKNYVAFAAGSGITPIISIIKTTLKTELASEFTLFYGNQTRETTMFISELENLQRTFNGRFSVFYIFSRENQDIDIFNGRIDEAKISSMAKGHFNPVTSNLYFVCGPGDMVQVTEKALINLGVSTDKIITEHFSNNPLVTPISLNGNSGMFGDHSIITSIQDGKTSVYQSITGLSILESALEQGASVPYACRSGVCATCSAKLLDGEVEILDNDCLSEEEINDGIILTCRTIPKSEQVTINFDL